MKIFPAIDIINGKCVRLTQGKFDDVKVFSDEPFKVAMDWESQGASYIHIVDLDGAKMGSAFNNETLKKIIANINVPVQVGGGIRNISDIKEKLQIGVSRVILGTVAISNPDFVKEAVDLFGDKIALGVDAKDGFVAIKGWQEISQKTAVDLCLDMKKIGIKTIIYTDISKDGMMSGPNVSSTKEIVDKTNLNVIASGGVTTYKDLDDVEKINAYGAIIGKALYNGNLNLKKVIEKYEIKGEANGLDK